MQLGTCESAFFARIESRIESAVRFDFEPNRPYTTPAVTQPNGLQAYHTACYRPIICWRLALWTCVLYLIHRYFVFVTNERVMYGPRNSELSTRLFQFSHDTHCQTMLLYAYFTPKVDFKRKFNHHQSFLYEWRLTARTIRIWQWKRGRKWEGQGEVGACTWRSSTSTFHFKHCSYYWLIDWLSMV